MGISIGDLTSCNDEYNGALDMIMYVVFFTHGYMLHLFNVPFLVYI